MSYCKGKKSVPVNIKLYNRVKSIVKRRVKRWPSAYASGQLVRMYKKKGGKYHCSKFGQFSFGSLNRWFKEKWVDVCTGKPCGRKKVGDKRKYPYCRPSRRVSSQTPRTSKELSKAEIKRRCALKHRLKGKRMKFGKNARVKIKLVSIKKSKISGKKYTATFEINGKSASVKVIHFGASGMSDFTKNLDIQRRNRYIKRHIKDLRTNNPIRAGYLSMFVLWNKKSLSSGIKDYRKRLSIYNSTGKFPKKILQK